MSEYVVYVLAIAVSGMYFMNLSAKRGWSEDYWRRINKKVDVSLNVVLWLIGAIIFQTAAGEVTKLITTNDYIVKTIIGISMGLSLAFIPKKNMPVKK